MTTTCKNTAESKLPKRRLRRPTLFGRFRKSEEGTAAVEMALLALPFFFTVGVFFELTIQYFATTILQTGVADLARQVRTRQVVAPITPAQVRSIVCKPEHIMFNCDDVVVDVQQVGAWGSPDVPTDPNGNFDPSGTGFAPGGARTIAIIRAYYQWPTFLPRFVDYGYGVARTDPGSTLLLGTTAVRIEP